MIQRIQTVYILLSLICLSIVLFGHNVLIDFFGTTIERYKLTFFGISNQEQAPLENGFNFPLYIFPIILIPLLVFALLSFKNLKRQGLLIQIALILYSLLILSIVLIYFFNDIKIDNVKSNGIIRVGFYILAIGLPSLYLANNGIKRDKKLIDSLNRLR